MRNYILILAVMLTTNLCQADDILKIINYQMDPMPVLDQNAKFIKNIPISELPSPEIDVIFFDKENELVKILNKDGTELWFDTFDLELNKGKVVALPCLAHTQTNSSNKTQAGTLGYGKNCNKEK